MYSTVPSFTMLKSSADHDIEILQGGHSLAVNHF